MNSEVLIDIGSSTIKVYQLKQEKLLPLLQRTIPFKNKFNPEIGISEENKKELFELIAAVKGQNKEAKIKIFATAVFRKLTPEARLRFVDEFFKRTGLFFNIISQDLENFYLEMALMGKCTIATPVLLINIGGGSTELVVVYGKEAIETANVEIGVGNVILEFPQINKEIAGCEIQEVIEFIKEKLPPLKNTPRIAFYTGGELYYMQQAGYPLKRNVLFKDTDHPLMITFNDFSKRNKEVFKTVRLSDLENLMPENPAWMHGARACSALAQAICQKYEIKTVIPSDSNIINGVVRQEIRYATISGSFRKHLDYILETKERLEKTGCQTLSPRFSKPKNPKEEFVVFDGEENLTPLELERHHLDSIKKSDVLVVCDPQGYVGASALIEIGFAHSLGKRTIFTEKPEEFMLNTLPAEVGF